MKSFYQNICKKLIFTLPVLIIIFLVTACNQSADQQKQEEEKTTITSETTTTTIINNDTTEATRSEASTKLAVKKNIEGGRYFNDVARLIAGLPQEEGSNLDSFQKSTTWKKYSQSISSNWKNLAQRQLLPMKNWAATELKEVHENTENVFYPFSGPDIMNAFTFFPQAQNYVLIGLEPIGSVPNFNNTPADSMDDYYAILNTSFYSIFNFSFFRTNSMATDLKNEDIDGTLPLMMVFLTRTGNKILDVRYVKLSDSGEAVVMAQAGQGRAPRGAKGVEIVFENKGQQKSAYYFSTNLADDPFYKNKALKSFVKNLQNPVTYLKSASYLMHKSYFSTIRKLILEKSKYVLQDDSGIPFNYYPADKWEVQLYGVYNKPIDLFAIHYQEDMKQAYKTGTVKPLPFGIGYNWQKNQSNLLLAKKKQGI